MTPQRRPARLRGAVLIAMASLLGCGDVKLVVTDAAPPAPQPDTAMTETVVFLVGDPGEAKERYHPIIPRLEAEMSRWAGALERDSAVVMVVLGDIVYPEGLRPDSVRGFAQDTAVLNSLIRLVTPARDTTRGGRRLALFLAGNHDWGYQVGRSGERRLSNLGRYLDRVRAETGAELDLLPPAGTAGPVVLDLGTQLRLILLDTAWWLLSRDRQLKDDLLEGIAGAMTGAGERSVVFAAHHPWASAGPHGGLVSFWETLGVGFLLARSGVLLQDLNSRPYKDLRSNLGAVFRRTRQPLVFAGGHEHSLQLVDPGEPDAPLHAVVSGSASKLTATGRVPGTRFALAQPGYAWLAVRTDGAVDLYFEAAPEEFLSCDDATDVQACMRRGRDAYRTVYSTRIRPVGTDIESPARP